MLAKGLASRPFRAAAPFEPIRPRAAPSSTSSWASAAYVTTQRPAAQSIAGVKGTAVNLHNLPTPAIWAPRERTLADTQAGRYRLLPLKWPTVRRRVTGVALVAAGYAATSAAVVASGPLSRAAAVQVLFAATMIVCTLSETLLSPAVPVITGDRVRHGAAGRARSRLGTRALAAGCLLGPAAGGAALGAGWCSSLLTTLAVACALAGIATQRPSGRRRPGPPPAHKCQKSEPYDLRSCRLADRSSLSTELA